MVVACEQVWREISNYLDGDVNPELHGAMEEHLRGCKHCAAVLEGTRNVINLYGDERMFEVPLGFSHRLHRRLEENMPSRKGTVLGWMVAFAFAALILISFEVGHSSAFRAPALRSELAEPAFSGPPEMLVVVSSEGKTFHTAGCRFIHDKAHLRTLAAGEALKEGYAPCVRCMKKYLSPSAIARLTATQPNAEPGDE